MSAIPVLVSRCLLGFACRYDGKAKPSILPLLGEIPEVNWIPVCPEVEGGRDCTREYCLGAQLALQSAETNRAKFALLKAKSPSCGTRSIYDGTFSRTLIPGRGITAELLAGAGIALFSEDELESFSRTVARALPESD